MMQARHSSTWQATRSPRRSPAHARGMTLIELITAASLLAVLFVTAVPILGWAGTERQNSANRQWALQEAANLMERLGQYSWDSLTDDELARLTVSQDLQQRLHGVVLSVHLDQPEEETLQAKQVTVTVRWKDRSNTLVRPVTLTAWFYKQGRTP